MKKVMVGMSGGVDSSVAAYLLKSEGYEVIGVTLKLCGENSGDIEDAKRVAKKIGIEHVSVDLSEEFRNKVINSFVDSYKNGETPNPCITCNKHIKFGDMLDFALESGMDFVATGHYANVVNTQDNRRLLLKSADASKDQTYFLYSLTQEQLSHVIFPLGNLSKDQVRKIAEEQGFVNARKRDSQDICFVPGGDYASFIEKYTGINFPIGDFVDTNGKKLGEHKGIIKYTVGQRKGLGIALGKPAFVCAKNVDSNTVVLGENKDLFSMELIADNVNLIPFDKIDEPIRVGAKIRYNQKEQPALVESIGEGAVRVVFDEPQRAVSKGQSVVFYSGNSVVGGGIIR